jgi:DNA (cytosine-5)-methyltransferase 1
MNYYNEFDPFAAAWLRELIKDKLIPEGEVDERSIIDVDGKDLKGFTQCHFFAGIGGWSYALKLAGWSADRPVWTGSPPCQPFSVAGNKKGQDDERHLWPHFFSLIRECSPPTVFGEQVAAAIRTEWFDDLQADMENEGYATAMAVLPACSVGAPHKRERLFFVAHSGNEGLQGSEQYPQDYREDGEGREGAHGSASELCTSDADLLAHSIDSGQSASEGRRSSSECTYQGNDSWWSGKTVECRDRKHRPIPTEPEIFPLANGIPNRVGLLRGAGNAIVPQVAAEIIKSFMEYQYES